MNEYRRYLAQQILTEDKLVTYRLLSRALKVHVNVAKEMLYDFHKWQNDKKPGTLHATYLIYGVHRQADENEGDIEMTDSQSESGFPLSEQVPTHTLTLVKEENLEDVLNQYQQVTSIHVYSLAPHPLKDLQVLSETAQDVYKLALADTSNELSRVYGGIANPSVRRREPQKGMPRVMPSAAPAAKATVKPQIKQEVKVAVKEEPKPAPSAPAQETKPPASTITKKSAPAPGLKRQGSSGIGQMFAKAAANPKKPAARTTSNKPSAQDEVSPALSDEGEDDSEMPDVKPDAEAGQRRKERQDKLRQMMEESDVEDDGPGSKADSPVEEPMEEEPSQVEPEPEAEEPAEMVASTSNGRKRGRRRVTKKKQIMDEAGYLVTIQEQGWESFSEDEAPPSQKAKVEKEEKAAPAAKSKKAAGKVAQGNIMSFFSKK